MNPVATEDDPTDVVLEDCAADWFIRMERPLYYFVKRLVGPEGDAADLVQETFVRFAGAWGTVENPRAWLYRTARNLSLNRIRKLSRETVVDWTDETTGAPPTGEEPLPDATADKLERHGFLHLVLSRLPEKRRAVVELKYMEDLSYAEIAERTGFSVSNVGFILSTTLREMAAELRNYGVGT